MNTTAADDLMASLPELRRALPTMRLGQFVANMATVACGTTPGAVWEAEDDELLAAIRWQLQQLDSPSDTSAEPVAPPDRGGVNGSSGSTSHLSSRPVS